MNDQTKKNDAKVRKPYTTPKVQYLGKLGTLIQAKSKGNKDAFPMNGSPKRH